MEKVKPVILMICDYYLPGFKGGGALRALVNLVDRLGDDYQFKIVTRDHDGPLNKTPYQDVQQNDWNHVGKAEVYYLSKDNVRIGKIKELIDKIAPDAIYLNSFFSPLTVFTLLLKRFSRIGQIPIALVPEGELTPGALKIKSFKKQLYLKAARFLKLNNVTWKVASAYEQAHLEPIFGSGYKVFIAPSMTEKVILKDFVQASKSKKESGRVKFVFLSRIAKKKNLHWFLDQISASKSKISIDIFGPVEDAEYWKSCENLIKKLPDNIEVKFHGERPYEKVPGTLLNYHFFVLPTLDENFGLVFVEGLAAGCPLMISDRTPWRKLDELGIGWDISLEKPELWLNAIETCVNMDDESYKKMSERSRKFAVEWLSDTSHEDSYRKMFDFVLGR